MIGVLLCDLVVTEWHTDPYPLLSAKIETTAVVIVLDTRARTRNLNKTYLRYEISMIQHCQEVKPKSIFN